MRKLCMNCLRCYKQWNFRDELAGNSCNTLAYGYYGEGHQYIHTRNKIGGNSHHYKHPEPRLSWRWWHFWFSFIVISAIHATRHAEYWSQSQSAWVLWQNGQLWKDMKRYWLLVSERSYISYGCLIHACIRFNHCQGHIRCYDLAFERSVWPLDSVMGTGTRAPLKFCSADETKAWSLRIFFSAWRNYMTAWKWWSRNCERHTWWNTTTQWNSTA